MFTFPFTLHSGGFVNEYSTSFNGVDEHISLGSIDIVDNLSIFFWAKYTSTTTMCFLSKFRAGTGNQSVRLQSVLGDFRVQIAADGSGTNKKTYTYSTNVNDGNWHHLGFTFVNDVLKVYVDGSEVSVSKSNDDTVTTIHSSAQSYIIGARGNLSERYNGNIDELTIWSSTVLSAGEISDLYNSGVPVDPNTIGATATLEHWYRMGDGDDATTLFDNAGSFDGTLTNMDATNYTTDVPS